MSCKWAVVLGGRNFTLICNKAKLSCSFSLRLKCDDALSTSSKIFRFYILNLLLINLSHSSKISLHIHAFELV